MSCQCIRVFLTWAGGRGPTLCTTGQVFPCYIDLVMAGSNGSTEKSPYMPVREARPGSLCATQEPLKNKPYSKTDTWVQGFNGTPEPTLPCRR